MAALKRDVKEEFRAVEIKTVHLLPHPVSSVGAGSGSRYVAFVEVVTNDAPLNAEPEAGEQIMDRAFVPLEFSLDRCLDQCHNSIFWGRICNF